ncbi:hypothetical protein Leryth_025766 [Lithospermum erythrorhizon]|uniref:Glycoside hydrolase family 5 domain-containing protein n=1 Tax=Lithospermum erythrorhizon TaxID=34254 RepID=A0AAV3P3K1_LITER|nr:hypothetical protein Leryth_025766 [Lithospermum erythrorhizon]
MSFTTLLLFLFSSASFSHALPLSTSSRWIVDAESGERVKLACVNWAAHLEPMLPEGLDKKPLNKIARHISSMGFNCVRLTWATHMFTRHANLTVSQNFHNLGLKDAISGIGKNNPELLSLTVVDAQKAVIEALGSHGVMVLLDNQVSRPMWCCDNHDGNGFFGDKYFGTIEWLLGLKIVARRYKNNPMVMAMSLRNELRGPNQNQSAWYKYVEKGANTIHKANPNVLILISGLDYDIDFSFLKKKPLEVNLNGKMVYEFHRYPFTEGEGPLWIDQPLDKQCNNITQELNEKALFLLKDTPLFVTEFGIDQTAPENDKGNLFLGCFLNLLAEHDLDWGVWALQGSYYYRSGLQDTVETFGMLNSSWTHLRSPTFLDKLQFIQQKIQDPKSEEPEHYVMFHPQSGRCVQVDDNNEVFASDCRSLSKWRHDGDGTSISLLGTPYCLTAVGEGLPVALTTNCFNEQSIWKLASSYQLANVGEDGTELCLEWNVDYNSRITTRKCMQAPQHPKNNLDNPQIQWFTLVKSNIKYKH